MCIQMYICDPSGSIIGDQLPLLVADIYDLQNVMFWYQNWAYADRPISIKFDADVYNVRSLGIGSSNQNFELKVGCL